MRYVDPSTGRTYPISEARWCADSGHHLNLEPGPGLRRRDIDGTSYSVWRYARALLVEAQHAVSLGEGWTPLLSGEWDDTLWQRLLGRPASESGTLRHGDGTHGRSDRCRRSFVLPILTRSREVLSNSHDHAWKRF